MFKRPPPPPPPERRREFEFLTGRRPATEAEQSAYIDADDKWKRVYYNKGQDGRPRLRVLELELDPAPDDPDPEF
jgi:hypothetical protein